VEVLVEEIDQTLDPERAERSAGYLRGGSADPLLGRIIRGQQAQAEAALERFWERKEQAIGQEALATLDGNYSGYLFKQQATRVPMVPMPEPHALTHSPESPDDELKRRRERVAEQAAIIEGQPASWSMPPISA